MRLATPFPHTPNFFSSLLWIFPLYFPLSLSKPSQVSLFFLSNDTQLQVIDLSIFISSQVWTAEGTISASFYSIYSFDKHNWIFNEKISLPDGDLFGLCCFRMP
ncbi:hypothetical protein MAP00_004574 [Monascus purpureus]|nr:hypothetical protein MAP00_004574 [Monascus purpureus]